LEASSASFGGQQSLLKAGGEFCLKHRLTANLTNIFVNAANGVIFKNNPSDGIDTQGLYFPRDALVSKLLKLVLNAQFVVLSAPPAYGKTSLLQLLKMKAYENNWDCVYISFAGGNPNELLRTETGIDVEGQKIEFELFPGQPILILLDDTQIVFNQVGFWRILVKAMPAKIGSNFSRYRFVFAATTDLSIQGSPVEFKVMPRLSRPELLLSAEEQSDLYDMCVRELPDVYRTWKALKMAVCKDSGGHVGVITRGVRCLADADKSHFDSKEEKALQYLYSKLYLELLCRCFSVSPDLNLPPPVSKFLSQIFVQAPMVMGVPSLDRDTKIVVELLVKGGVMIYEGSLVKFATPAAKRFFYDRLFPSRSSFNPETIEDLALGAIATMSSNVLRTSLGLQQFPKETTWQHLFMQGMQENLTSHVTVCPEFSGSFLGTPKIDGEVDFYVNGNLKWGLELLVLGHGIKEHLNRFAPGGAYAPINASDFLVIDFRKGPKTTISKFQNRLSLFFSQDFRKVDYVLCKNNTIREGEVALKE